MLFFSNAKINIGLHITSKRSDGFHNLETIFYPIQLTDVIEFSPSERLSFKNDGFQIDCPPDKNLVIKTYQLLKEKFSLPELTIHILKNIPFGAGLGGGSSNASNMLLALNSYFNLNIAKEELLQWSESIGSDCPFFIHNTACYATSKGEVLESIKLDLSNYYFVIVKPDFPVNTKEAFAEITPNTPSNPLKDMIEKPVTEWKDYIFNDFEKPLFKKHPEIKRIKEKFYDLGALYASMSGSGSAVYGIFNSKIELKNTFPEHYFVWSDINKKG